MFAIPTDFSPLHPPINNAVNLGLVQHADHDGRISEKQSEILRAIIGIPDHTEIMAELEQLRFHLNEDQLQRGREDQNFLRQLSVLDFTAVQKESYSKRCANTGQWLIESSEFQTWLKSEDVQYSVLWCPGNPGAGKTVITSIAVNNITENPGGRRNAVVYIYCDYANALTFSVENLLGSVVRQLIAQTSHARTVAELQAFLKQTTKNRNMTEEEFSSWTETLSRTFDVVYTFVDALDECPEIVRGNLLTRLHLYSQANMRIFLTSRFNVDVTARIPHATRTAIAADSHDITVYVESKIREIDRLARLDPGFKQHIVERIITQSDGMFLLAGLQISSLGNQTSIKGIRLALERLPTDIFTMYDQTIERIRDQSQENAELGLKVLSTIFSAVVPLQIDQLRHALAVQPGVTVFDFEAVVDLDILLSVTAGLVITYEVERHGAYYFRLVHYTLQEYLERNQERLFPNLQLEMARACLSYLSLDENGRDELRYEKYIRTDGRTGGGFPFVYYAATYWAHHLRGVQKELMDQSLAFVEDSTKTSVFLIDLKLDDCYYGERLFTSADLRLDPLFITAHFHLLELFRRTISSRNINTRNLARETPLLRTVHVRTHEKGRGLLPVYLEDAQTWQEGWESPFYGPLDVEQYAMVQALLELGADIDAKDSWGSTAAMCAVNKKNGGTLSLLLDYGADVNTRMHGRWSLLHAAVQHDRRVAIVRFLLGKGADFNALTERGQNVVHIAVDYKTSAMLDYLIDYGVPFDIADEEGYTPILLAIRKDRPKTLAALINHGAPLDFTDFMGRTPLHCAIPNPDVVEVVMQTQRVDVIDRKGRTPLHHAYFNYARNLKYHAGCQEIKLVIRLLIEGGASETVTDVYGRVPKEYSDRSTLAQFWSGYPDWPTTGGPVWQRVTHEDQTKDVNKPEENSEAEEKRREEHREGDQPEGCLN